MKIQIKNLHDRFIITGKEKRKLKRLAVIAAETVNKTGDFFLSVVFTNDEHITTLNKIYRKKNKPTDVLAFPMDLNPSSFPDIPWMIGEIIISIDTCQKNAEKEEITLEQKIFQMFIHGFIHLLGYHHDTPEKYEKMSDLHKSILTKFYMLNRSKK